MCFSEIKQKKTQVHPVKVKKYQTQKNEIKEKNFPNIFKLIMNFKQTNK